MSLGTPVPEWKPPPRPFAAREEQYRWDAGRLDVCCDVAKLPDWAQPVLVGKSCSLVPLHVGHAEVLFDAFMTSKASSTTTTEDVFKYLNHGPYTQAEQLQDWIAKTAVANKDFIPMAILDGPDPSAQPVGYVCYLAISPSRGSVEVGHVTFSPLLQRTRAATEVHFLLMQHAFELGYRRYEWKCNSLNMPSRRAAQRFGFSFEGVLRQVAVVKGHNRDTAYFSILDSEWPQLKVAFETYLADSNFDTATGGQLQSLSALTKPLLAKRDPCLEDA
mmetsp:Transcript_43074/g.99160  ORF Transcript_43074/g.99160 Transcript_43074/m.99160 type:complete len:275 (-) Transcript_43074:65-889(-)